MQSSTVQPLKAKFPVDTEGKRQRRKKLTEGKQGIKKDEINRQRTNLDQERSPNAILSAQRSHQATYDRDDPLSYTMDFDARRSFVDDGGQTLYRHTVDPNLTSAGERAAKTVELLIPGSMLRPASGYGRVKLKVSRSTTRPATARIHSSIDENRRLNEQHPTMKQFTPETFTSQHALVASLSAKALLDHAAAATASKQYQSKSVRPATARPSSSPNEQPPWWTLYNFPTDPLFRFVNLQSTALIIQSGGIVSNSNIQLAFTLKSEGFESNELEDWNDQDTEHGPDRQEDEQIEYEDRQGHRVRFKRVKQHDATSTDPAAARLRRQRPIVSTDAQPSITLTFQTHLPPLFSLVDDAHYVSDSSVCPSRAGMIRALALQYAKLTERSKVKVGDIRLVRFALESILYSLEHIADYTSRMDWSLHYISVTMKGPLMVFIGSYQDVHIVIAASAKMGSEREEELHLQQHPHPKQDGSIPITLQTGPGALRGTPSVSSLPLPSNSAANVANDLRSTFVTSQPPQAWLMQKTKLYVIHLPTDVVYSALKQAVKELHPLPPTLGESIIELLRVWEQRNVRQNMQPRSQQAKMARPAGLDEEITSARIGRSTKRSATAPSQRRPRAASAERAEDVSVTSGAGASPVHESLDDSSLIHEDTDTRESEWDTKQFEDPNFHLRNRAGTATFRAPLQQAAAQDSNTEWQGYFGQRERASLAERPYTAESGTQRRGRSAMRTVGDTASYEPEEIHPSAGGVSREVSYVSEQLLSNSYFNSGAGKRLSRHIEVQPPGTARVGSSDSASEESKESSGQHAGSAVYVRVGDAALRGTTKRGSAKPTPPVSARGPSTAVSRGSPQTTARGTSDSGGTTARSVAQSKNASATASDIPVSPRTSGTQPLSLQPRTRTPSPVLSFFGSGSEGAHAHVHLASDGAASTDELKNKTGKRLGSEETFPRVSPRRQQQQDPMESNAAQFHDAYQSAPPSPVRLSRPEATLAETADFAVIASPESASVTPGLPETVPVASSVISVPGEAALREVASAAATLAVESLSAPSPTNSPSVFVPAELLAMAVEHERSQSRIQTDRRDADRSSGSLVDDLAAAQPQSHSVSQSALDHETQFDTPVVSAPPSKRPQSAFIRRTSGSAVLISGKQMTGKRPTSAMQPSDLSGRNAEPPSVSVTSSTESSRPISARTREQDEGFNVTLQAMVHPGSSEDHLVAIDEPSPSVSPPVAVGSLNLVSSQSASPSIPIPPPLSFSSFIGGDSVVRASLPSSRTGAAVVSIPAGHPLSYNRPMSALEIQNEGVDLMTSLCALESCGNKLYAVSGLGYQLHKCVWCGRVIYCSPACMVEDWLSGKHPAVCTESQEAARAHAHELQQHQVHRVPQGQGWMDVIASSRSQPRSHSRPGSGLSSPTSRRRTRSRSPTRTSTSYEEMQPNSAYSSELASPLGAHAFEDYWDQAYADAYADIGGGSYEETAFGGPLSPSEREDAALVRRQKEVESRVASNDPQSLSAAMRELSMFPSQPAIKLSARSKSSYTGRPTVADLVKRDESAYVPVQSTPKSYEAQQIEMQRAYALLYEELRASDASGRHHQPSVFPSRPTSAKIAPPPHHAEPQHASMLLARFQERSSKADHVSGTTHSGSQYAHPSVRPTGGMVLHRGVRTGGGGSLSLHDHPTVVPSLESADVAYVPLASTTQLYAKTRGRPGVNRPHSAHTRTTANGGVSTASVLTGGRTTKASGAFVKGFTAPKLFGGSGQLDFFMRITQRDQGAQETARPTNMKSSPPPVIPVVDLRRAISAARPTSARLASNGRAGMPV